MKNPIRQKTRKAMIITSLLLFPLTLNFFSPYLIIEGTALGIITGSFLLFVLLFFGSLFLGRAFCGWLCPGAGLQEVCFVVRDRRVTKGYWVKYVIWTIWMGCIVFLAIRAKGYHTLQPLYQFSGEMNTPIYFTVVSLIVLLSFLVGKRSFCHHGCWMAPFMVLGLKVQRLFKWPSLRLKVDQEKCISCHHCDRECPMSLVVTEMVKQNRMAHDECILCGNCVDVCPKGVIAYTWRNGEKGTKNISNTSCGSTGL